MIREIVKLMDVSVAKGNCINVDKYPYSENIL